MSKTAVVALGSNSGTRHAHLHYAVAELKGSLDGVRVSAFLETAPAPPARETDPPFLNAVVLGQTMLSAWDLLERLLAIERRRGRARPYAGAPRSLDLDLVLLGDEVLNEPGLEVPHPRFRERRFVLEPLAQLAPDLRDPVTGLTIRELLDRLRP